MITYNMSCLLALWNNNYSVSKSFGIELLGLSKSSEQSLRKALRQLCIFYIITPYYQIYRRRRCKFGLRVFFIFTSSNNESYFPRSLFFRVSYIERFLKKIMKLQSTCVVSFSCFVLWLSLLYYYYFILSISFFKIFYFFMDLFFVWKFLGVTAPFWPSS